MKINKKHKITLLSVLGLLLILLFAVTFREGLDNPEADTIQCSSKGLKCDNNNSCCEGLKCLGNECK